MFLEKCIPCALFSANDTLSLNRNFNKKSRKGWREKGKFLHTSGGKYWRQNTNFLSQYSQIWRCLLPRWSFVNLKFKFDLVCHNTNYGWAQMLFKCGPFGLHPPPQRHEQTLDLGKKWGLPSFPFMALIWLSCLPRKRIIWAITPNLDSVSQN